eukprot:CAMPEP_0194703774 /NCGR_PEP_ID=MMETSP0295-20121207/27812_1 /TAXON_ID=39354 /ORGANISM="Heterosigma akashiwo, Strain CCMP2393" /LENGTH=78 /DNA_ID=CAMNT_0039598881 /DNA_START=89 /DNA_END=325 /DNA_ORIENTATION=-
MPVRRGGHDFHGAAAFGEGKHQEEGREDGELLEEDAGWGHDVHGGVRRHQRPDLPRPGQVVFGDVKPVVAFKSFPGLA